MILGGGLAGLAASYYSNAPIFEAENFVGGVAASDRLDGAVFDRGIHILQTQNKTVLELLDHLGVKLTTRKRIAYIYSHNCYTAYPFQVNTAGLPFSVRVRCLTEYLTRRKHAERIGKPCNYEDWIRQSLGDGFAETFLIPYSDKFWTVHPSDMTHEWTGNRVPKPTTWQVLRGSIWSKQTKIGTNATFQYPEGSGGYGTIAEALKKQLTQVNLGHRATRIDVKDRRIEFNNEKELDYQSLISTIPLPELIKICSDVPAEVAEAASQLRANSIMVVNLEIDRPNISDKNWVHFPESDVSFFRISYPHTFTQGVTSEDRSSISAEIAYSDERPIDATNIIERTVRELRSVNALPDDANIIASNTHDIRYAYCIYDKQRKTALKTIRSWLSEYDIVPAGRYGLWCYFWGDESILSGKHAAELVKKRQKLSGGPGYQ